MLMKRLIRINAVVEVDEEDDESCVFAVTEELNEQVTLQAGNDRVKSMLVMDVTTNRPIYEKLTNGKNDR